MRTWTIVLIVMLLVLCAGCSTVGSDNAATSHTTMVKTPTTEKPSKTTTVRTTKVSTTRTNSPQERKDLLPLSPQFGGAEVTVTQSRILHRDSEILPSDKRALLVLNVRVADTKIPGGPGQKEYLVSDNLELFDTDGNAYNALGLAYDMDYRLVKDGLDNRQRACMNIGEVREGIQIYDVPEGERQYVLFLTNRSWSGGGDSFSIGRETHPTGVIAKTSVPPPSPIAASDPPVQVAERSSDFGKVSLTVQNAWIIDHAVEAYGTYNHVIEPMRDTMLVAVDFEVKNNGIQSPSGGLRLRYYQFGLMDETGIFYAIPAPGNPSTDEKIVAPGGTRRYTHIFQMPLGIDTNFRLILLDSQGVASTGLSGSPKSIAEAPCHPVENLAVTVTVQRGGGS